ncbi:hypothetical protein DFA_00031 [Cavenderia fasciculata]|uniref:SWIM-type domain-containing protein n=1 Tax=Cavenderia fasciculata TaxID=261658 RepID=F4PXE4_CACFS|nr:uncharacterized protein DFA_00031 [Cavenderia fasciculata]EGG19454.1 hypothetical protein DFA_00031 [Cavenderia fasciculata]|eukprot:XP_004357748.1 hypothetical protein DFA_00031 [Cavenderia fasciculata]
MGSNKHETYGEVELNNCGFTHVDATMEGTVGTYTINIDMDPKTGKVSSDCSCPVGDGWCKHIRATAIAMYYNLKQKSLSSFTPKVQYKESLDKMSKDELVGIIMELKFPDQDDDEEDEEDNEDDDEDEDDDDDDDEDEDEDENYSDSSFGGYYNRKRKRYHY